MLPWCAEFRIGELEKEGLALVCVFFFLLPPKLILVDTPWYVFTLYIYPSRNLDAALIALSSVRADPTYEAIHNILRCGSVWFSKIENPKVLFLKIVNTSVGFGAFMYRTVRFGAVSRYTKSYGACGSVL